MKKILFKIGVLSFVVSAIFSIGLGVKALTVDEAKTEIRQITGEDRLTEGVGAELIATAYINSRENNIAPTEALQTILANEGVRTETNGSRIFGITGDGTRWIKEENSSSWKVIRETPVVDGVQPVNRYEFVDVVNNNNVQQLTSSELNNEAAKYQPARDNDSSVDDSLNQVTNSQDQDNLSSFPDNNNQPQTTGSDILEPQPLDLDNLPDSTGGEPNQSATENTTPGMFDSTTGVTNQGNITSTAKICAEEGLKGVDFLVFHGPLVPCGINKTCENSEGKTGELAINKPCTICHFIILIKNVFDLLLSMIITASLFMLTIAGVLYIVSSGGQMTGIAKGIIEKTLLGFGIFLLSWLIVYTLLNMLSVRETDVLGKGGTDSWFQFSCDTESSFYTPGSGTQPPNPEIGTQPPITNSEIYSKSDAERVFREGSVTVKDGVKIDGIKQNAADGLANVAKQCNATMPGGCNTVLTAALDGTHKNPDNRPSHYTGDKTDIRSRDTTPNLNKFLIGTSDTSTASSIPRPFTKLCLTDIININF